MFLKDSREHLYFKKRDYRNKVRKCKGLDKNIIYFPNIQSFPLLQLDKNILLQLKF